jgi:type IV pilus assembly protein PilO
MLASRTSRWTAGTMALCVLLLVGSWFLLVGPRQAETVDLQEQRDAAIATNDGLELEIAQLQAQSKALPERQAQLAAIKREFPAQVQLPKLIRNLDTFATQSGVQLDSLSPGTPVAVVSAVQAPAAPAAAAGGATTPSGQAAPPQAAAADLLQVPVTVQVSGDYFQVATFVKRLQQMDRVALISGLAVISQLGSESAPGSVTTTLSGFVFVLPDSGAATATGAGQPAVPAPAGGSTTQ